MKQRFSEEQRPGGIRAILQEGDRAPSKAALCRQHGISEVTYYRWKQRYQGLDVPHLRRLKHLEQEKDRLKKLVAEQALAQEALKEALAKRPAIWRQGSAERTSVGASVL